MLCFKRTLTLLFVCLTPVAPHLIGQGVDDPRVEALYDKARQAQQEGDLATAIARYEDILHIDPKLGVAYNNLGALYFRQRSYSKAINVLERGLKVSPGLPSANALLGISLYETAAYGRARTALESAVKANPNDTNAQIYLARDLVKLGDMGAAVSSLQKTALREPKNQEIFYLLAKVYMQLSEQSLARMNAIDPNSVLAHQLSAEVMESMNNYEGAVVQLKKAVEMAPQTPGNHYKLGDAYWSLSQWDQAAEEFQAELTVDPANCSAQWKLGNIVLQKGGQAEDALSTLNKAISACPDLADAREDRARAFAKLDRNQEAIADLEIAERATPNDPGIHFLLSKAYRAVGRSSDAGREMQVFSKLDESARAATAERAEQVIRNKQAAH